MRHSCMILTAFRSSQFIGNIYKEREREYTEDPIQAGDEVRVILTGTAIESAFPRKMIIKTASGSVVSIDDCESAEKIEVLDNYGIYQAADGIIWRWSKNWNHFEKIGDSLSYGHHYPKRPLKKITKEPY